MKKVVNKGKRLKTLSEVNAVEHTNKNPQSFLEINSVQKKVLPPHRLQNHAYE